MFTTITKLRKSHALQDRVTKVENWMKKNVPNFTSDTPIPIHAIGNSNPIEDVYWVVDMSSVHCSWPEVEKHLLQQGQTTNDFLEEMLQEMRRNKASTISKYTEMYNAAFLKAYPQPEVIEQPPQEFKFPKAEDFAASTPQSQQGQTPGQPSAEPTASSSAQPAETSSK